MNKINIRAEKEFEKSYPEKWIAFAEMITNDGEKISAKIEYPRGHPNNPLTKEEILNKFLKLVKDFLSRNQSEKIRDNILNLEKVRDMGNFLATCDFYE